jgi:RecB family endonuclease NucS
LLGVQLNTKKAGVIDILALDGEDNFVILELKKAKAPDSVVAQVDRYIEWVERHLAQPTQDVRAIVIAQRFDSRLLYTLARQKKIGAIAFKWEIGLSLSEKSLPNRISELAT